MPDNPKSPKKGKKENFEISRKGAYNPKKPKTPPKINPKPPHQD